MKVYTAEGQERYFEIAQGDALELSIPFLIINNKDGLIKYIINMAECQAVNLEE